MIKITSVEGFWSRYNQNPTIALKVFLSEIPSYEWQGEFAKILVPEAQLNQLKVEVYPFHRMICIHQYEHQKNLLEGDFKTVQRLVTETELSLKNQAEERARTEAQQKRDDRNRDADRSFLQGLADKINKTL